MKGVAFALGGAGLALFLAGVVWALVAPADSSGCPTTLHGRDCEQYNFERLAVKVGFLVVGGLVLEMVAVVFMFLHFRQQRQRRSQAYLPPPSRGNGPAVSVTRRDR